MNIRPFTRVIGACCNYGQPKLGTNKAPYYIHQCLSSNLDMDLIEGFNENGRGYNELFALHNHYLHLHHKIITLGGDHSISLSTVASSVEKYGDDLTVVWVDAHPDLHTRKSSKTKNIHGMPLGSALGLDNMFNLPTIKPNQLIYIGIRDIDPYEQEMIEKLNIEYYTSKHIHKYGLKDIIRNIKKIHAPIHLSLDVDVIDPKYFKSTGTTVDNGLSLKDIDYIIENLKGNVISSDIVEFNPYLTDKNIKDKEASYINNYIHRLL